MLEVHKVTKRHGAITAVRDVSFTVRPGEVFGYLGPNGSGKSTTVKMLAGLMPPSLGTIHFDGRDIQGDLIGFKAQVGYVPEDAHVYTYLTAPEYLRLCGRLRGIALGPLDQKIDRFLRILGLDTDRYATLAAFSKGMRQKILTVTASDGRTPLSCSVRSSGFSRCAFATPRHAIRSSRCTRTWTPLPASCV